MDHSIRPTIRRDGARFFRPALVALALTAGAAAAGPARQAPAPYQLFVRTDCELKSTYSAEQKSTTVQLALTPPGPGDMPSGVSLILSASHPGMQPAAPGSDIAVLVLPSANANPNLERGLELKFTIERRRGDPIELDYFGTKWGEYGYIPAGGEITRVVFSMSLADLRALLQASRVTGRAMNSAFVLTDKHLAALRLFALAIGVSGPTPAPLAR